MRFRLAEAALGGNSTIDFYSLLLFHPYASVVVDEETQRDTVPRDVLHASHDFISAFSFVPHGSLVEQLRQRSRHNGGKKSADRKSTGSIALG